jgi:hypothetical protein
VQRITDRANRALRDDISYGEFLAGYLAQASARKVWGMLNLPMKEDFISRLAVVLRAEAKDTGLPIQDTAKRVMDAASEERRRGGKVNIFYFEDMRWRSSAGLDKAEQRKLNNLEVNARVKQRYRERFGTN